jgi:hypothetical protein
MTRGRANVLPPLALVSTVVLLWAATQSHVAAFAPANPASLSLSSRIRSSKMAVVRQRVVVPSLGEQAAARGKQLNIPRLALSAHNHDKNRGRHVLLQATATSSYQAVEDSAEEKEDRRAYRCLETRPCIPPVLLVIPPMLVFLLIQDAARNAKTCRGLHLNSLLLTNA